MKLLVKNDKISSNIFFIIYDLDKCLAKILLPPIFLKSAYLGERILILLEEQDEKELAIQKLNELIDIFKKIESGVFDINV